MIFQVQTKEPGYMSRWRADTHTHADLDEAKRDAKALALREVYPLGTFIRVIELDHTRPFDMDMIMFMTVVEKRQNSKVVHAIVRES